MGVRSDRKTPPVWLSGLVQLLLWVLLRTDSDEVWGLPAAEGTAGQPGTCLPTPFRPLAGSLQGVLEEFRGRQEHAPPSGRGAWEPSARGQGHVWSIGPLRVQAPVSHDQAHRLVGRRAPASRAHTQDFVPGHTKGARATSWGDTAQRRE